MKKFSGKTIEEATNKGLKELKLTKKLAEIRVVQEPKDGVFGFFVKEAEVEIRALTEEELKKREREAYLDKRNGILISIVMGVCVVGLIIYSSTHPSEDENKETSPSSSYVKSSSSSSLAKSSSSSSSSSSSVSSSSSSETLPSSSLSQTEISSSSSPRLITAENNPEFAAVLQTEDANTISTFVENNKGKTIEFNAYIATFSPSGNYRTRYDFLLYAGDFQGADVATPGPNFQFSNIAPTTVFRDFPGDSIRPGQNIHVIASIQSFTSGELLVLEPIAVTPR